MDEHLLRLLSLASEPILTSPHAAELRAVSQIGAHSSDLCEMLSWKNGWYAFESSLHVFPLGKKEGVIDLQTWNSGALWRNEYRDLAKDYFFFAEDIFGVQFCMRAGEIATFDSETAETQNFATDLGEWARKILDDYNLHTGFGLAHQWQEKHGALKPGKRLLPKIPFVLQGSYAVENLYELDCVEGMKLRASIAMQLRDLPNGSKVKLRVDL